MINDDDELIKNVEIKLAFAHKSLLFQKFEFQNKFEHSKQDFKKRAFIKKLINIIKNDAQFNRLI